MLLLDTFTFETSSLVTFYAHHDDAKENAAILRREGNTVKVGQRTFKLPTGTVSLSYTAIVD